MSSNACEPRPGQPAREDGGRRGPKPCPWPQTHVSKTLWPPQSGTKRWLDRYGEALVCVRYRHDALGRQRTTTVELRVDEGPVRTPRGGRRLYEWEASSVDDRRRKELVDAGAVWDPAHAVWRLSLSTAKRLGLEGEVTKGAARPQAPRPDGSR